MSAEQSPRYQPTDSSVSPRFTGVRTYARCPLSDDWAGADVAVLGVPFDTAVSFRPGARYGPAAIREMSLMMRRWHPALEVDVFESLSVVDGGDIITTPGNAERTMGQIADALTPVADYNQPRGWGFEIVPCEELRTWSAEQYGARVKERLGDGPAYLSFDVDVLDPASLPAPAPRRSPGCCPTRRWRSYVRWPASVSSASTSSRSRPLMTAQAKSRPCMPRRSPSRCWR